MNNSPTSNKPTPVNIETNNHYITNCLLLPTNNDHQLTSVFADYMWVGLLRNATNNYMYWHDGTPYNTSLGSPVTNDAAIVATYLYFQTHFDDWYDNKENYLCQGNADEVPW